MANDIVDLKKCPNCGAAALLNAPSCSVCGHVFRTKFVVPVQDRTQLFTKNNLSPSIESSDKQAHVIYDQTYPNNPVSDFNRKTNVYPQPQVPQIFYVNTGQPGNAKRNGWTIAGAVLVGCALMIVVMFVVVGCLGVHSSERSAYSISTDFVSDKLHDQKLTFSPYRDGDVHRRDNNSYEVRGQSYGNGPSGEPVSHDWNTMVQYHDDGEWTLVRLSLDGEVIVNHEPYTN